MIDENIGIDLPFARKRVEVIEDPNDDQVLRTINNEPQNIEKTMIFSRAELMERPSLPILPSRESRFPQYSIADATVRCTAERPTELTIHYPLFRVVEVVKIEYKLMDKPVSVDRSTKSWIDNCGSYSKDFAEIMRAQHPTVKFVELEDGKFARSEFVVPVAYTTNSGRLYRQKELVRGTDQGVFQYKGSTFIWKLCNDYREVQVFEAWMARRVRRLVAASNA